SPERIIVAPDCGLKYLPRDVAYGKMCAMVEGAASVRAELARGTHTDGRYDLSNLARRLLSAAEMAYRSRTPVEDGAARADGRPVAGRARATSKETRTR